MYSSSFGYHKQDKIHVLLTDKNNSGWELLTFFFQFIKLLILFQTSVIYYNVVKFKYN